MRIYILIVFLITEFFLSIFSSDIVADDLGRKFGIGLGIPYLSLKYGLSSKLYIEARGAYGDGIQVYGGRLYLNLTPEPKNRYVFYTGVEADIIKFQTNQISGSGRMGTIFLGGEYFISNKFTISLDLGPGYIELKDSQYSDINQTGLEWILNIGVNFYFDIRK